MSDPSSNDGPDRTHSADVSQSQGVQIGSHNKQINYIAQIAEGRPARPARITAHGEIVSPYKGLDPFGEEDAAFFFGRDQATDEILSRLTRQLETHVPLVVSGASGAGKSSLLRAGVLPRMSAAGLPGYPGARLWPRVTVTPARAPLAELAAAIAPLTGTDAASLRRSLSVEPSGFADVAHSIARSIPNGPSRLVLVIDQFEQAFTQCPDDSERDKFIAALHAAATVGHGTAGTPAALVALIVRADFETRCAEEHELTQAVQSRYLLTSMNELQLRLAITGPAEAANTTVELALADELVRAARGSSSGVLPHLSHTLDQAWRQRAQDDVLGLDDYERTGGIEGSIRASADRAYASLTPEQQMLVRPLFMRLVAVSSDLMVSAGRATRSELASRSAASDVAVVVEAFAAERLLTVHEDSVEISHEVLLTAWGRLRDWLADDRIDLARYSRLIADAADWDTRGRPASYLYPAGRLAEVDAAAKRWASLPGRYPALGLVPRDFLKAAGRATGQARWRRRGVLTGLAALTVAAITGAALAGSYAADANHQSVVAESRALAAQSLSIEQSNPLAADQLAAAAWHESPTPQAASAMTALLAQHEHSGELPDAYPDGLMYITLSPDGALLAAVNDNSHFLRLWDTANGKPVASPLPVGPRAGDVGSDVAFSPDGKLLASAGGTSSDGYLRLWNPATGALVRTFPPVADQLSAIAFSPDGKTLVSADVSGNVYVWSLATGKRVGAPLNTGESAVTDIAISPNGKLLAEADVPDIGIWDITTGRAAVKPWRADSEMGAESVAFSPDGRLLASGNSDGYVRLWNPATGKLVGKPLPAALPVSTVNGVAFSPDGKLLASADGDGYVKLWNPATGKQIGSPMAADPNSGGVNAVAFSSETGLLASGEGNGTIQLWNAAAERPIGATLQITGAVQYSPQASLLTSDADGYVRNTHVVSPGNFLIVNPTQALSAEGNVFAVPDSNMVQIVTKETTKLIPAAPGRDNIVGAIALSPDGKLLAASDKGGHVRLWETSTGKPTGVSLPADKNGVGSMAFSPNGKLLAVGDDDDDISLWNPITGSPIQARLSAGASLNNGIIKVAFSPDNKMLASASTDGKVRLWDPESGRLLGTLAPGPAAGDLAAVALAFSPSGLLAVEYSDGTIQLWNTHTHAAVGAPLPPSTSTKREGFVPLTTLWFSRDGSLLLGADLNGHAFDVTPWEVWQYTNPYAALCDEVGPPTKATWEQYSSGIQEPSGTCAGVPPASALDG